ncbi:MAG: fatty acid cis/trans isomerase [bacterium]|nr:fatty acid cis/trans isomerase [bacterium]
MKRLHVYLPFILIFISACGLLQQAELNRKYGPVQPIDRHVDAVAPGEVSYVKDVQPILEHRCISCHACYDAPCQLKLNSFEGLERGGSTNLVYKSSRITADNPTRLFVDAQSVEEWRGMEFHPVLNERDQTETANLDNSLITLMLQLKQDYPQPTNEILPKTFNLDLDRKTTCTKAEDFSKYKEKYPYWGMPYALPGLQEEEHETIIQWLKEGARSDEQFEMSEQATQIVAEWEEFFNGSSLKEQLVSRYIYEHIFIGHIHFDTLPEREFYRLVRSKTPPGEPLDEINTGRPYDAPRVKKFYYRLRKVPSTIVVKNHTVYRINDKTMERYKELFLQDNYEVDTLPGYDTETAANPFKAFADLPPRSRYKFMLDQARFTIMGFIKGPVCRGQVALNVINDHFWVVFTDPDQEDFSTNVEFLRQVSDDLSLPSERKNSVRIVKIWKTYSQKQRHYWEAKEQFLRALDAENEGPDINVIWAGGGWNDDALLTVFRHFDSASVEKGFIGQIPKTGWVIDYPLLERIHYLLVAGFDVFGNFGHQLETRLYMDFLRMEGENNFLRFLPKDLREETREDWYQGEKSDFWEKNPQHGLDRPTAIVYKSEDPKQELFEQILEYVGPGVAGPPDLLNRCNREICIAPDAGSLEQKAEQALQQIPKIHGTQIQLMPDVVFLHIMADDRDNDLVYTIVRNKALSNNSVMFREDRSRVVEDDTISVIQGQIGSYPNAFARVHIDRIEEFVDDYIGVKDELSAYYFQREYAVGRTSPDFWEEADWHYQKFLRDDPVEGGQFDLNRFHRISDRSQVDPTW